MTSRDKTKNIFKRTQSFVLMAFNGVCLLYLFAADALYEPGWITGVNGKKLSIKFSTGKRLVLVFVCARLDLAIR